MKQIVYVLIITVLIACKQNGSTHNNLKVIKTSPVISDSAIIDKNDEINKNILKDSLLSVDYTLFTSLVLTFNEISKNEFQSYKREYKTKCTLDTGQFISGSGLYVDTDCNEICQTYLVEKATNKKLLLPSIYDSGVLKMLLSPTCNQLIVCSSYDGSDFGNYYENRAEFYVLDIDKTVRLKAIKPRFSFYTKDWSIDDIIWVNEKTIALKTYEENKSEDKDSIKYKYFKTTFYQ